MKVLVYLYPKKDFMKKDSSRTSRSKLKIVGFGVILLKSFRVLDFLLQIYNQNQWDLSKITPKSTIFNFDKLVLEEK